MVTMVAFYMHKPLALRSDHCTVGHGGTKLYNGNISETEWRTGNEDQGLKWYKYSYDALNRITSATGNTSNYDLSSVAYDRNGNITSLVRRGHTNLGATAFGTMDDLVYTYDAKSNKLKKVLDNGNGTYGFKDGSDMAAEYTYDGNGNMLRDYNKGISSDITYNHLNLPTNVPISGGNISYIYDATGAKLKKTVSTGATTEYAGGYVYEDGSLKFFGHPEGYVEPDGQGGFDYVYQYKDHLGNIRLSYRDSDGNGSIDPSTEILEESNYYPFGLKHKGYNNVVNSSNKALDWKYNGVEFEESLGLNLYEMDVRMYDPAIARFNGMDPVTHHSQGTSVAFDNNPVFWADPSGAEAYTFINNGSQGFADAWNSLVQQSKTWGTPSEDEEEDGNNNTSNNNGFVKTGKGRYYNKESNIYLNINNSQKVDEDAFGYIRAEVDLSVGPQTRDGGTLLGFGTKSNAGLTVSVGSIEILATLDKTIINVSYVGKDTDIEDLLKSATLTVDINKSFYGGAFSIDAGKNIDVGANLGPLKIYDGDRQVLAIKLIEGNVSFMNIGGVDMVGVTGNVEFRFNRPFYNDKKMDWDYKKARRDKEKKERVYFRR